MEYVYMSFDLLVLKLSDGGKFTSTEVNINETFNPKVILYKMTESINEIFLSFCVCILLSI